MSSRGVRIFADSFTVTWVTHINKSQKQSTVPTNIPEDGDEELDISDSTESVTSSGSVGFLHLALALIQVPIGHR